MWMVTKAEAIEMYARYWSTRFGSTASSSARKMANSLEKKGDLDGHRVWNEVADTIDKHHHEKRRQLRNEAVTPASQSTQ